MYDKNNIQLRHLRRYTLTHTPLLQLRFALLDLFYSATSKPTQDLWCACVFQCGSKIQRSSRVHGVTVKIKTIILTSSPYTEPGTLHVPSAAPNVLRRSAAAGCPWRAPCPFLRPLSFSLFTHCKASLISARTVALSIAQRHRCVDPRLGHSANGFCHHTTGPEHTDLNN